jgi:F-type H+-transporting ATPase subunit delta
VASDERVVKVLANPAIPVERRAAVLAELLGDRASRPVQNLIQLLLRRGRIEALPRVAAEFRRLDDERQGITKATATTAAPLTPDEVRTLTERLELSTGRRVVLDVEIDPSLLGGLVVRVGDRMIDGSVRGRLERLRNQLISGAL